MNIHTDTATCTRARDLFHLRYGQVEAKGRSRTIWELGLEIGGFTGVKEAAFEAVLSTEIGAQEVTAWSHLWSNESSTPQE